MQMKSLVAFHKHKVLAQNQNQPRSVASVACPYVKEKPAIIFCGFVVVYW